MIEAIFSVNEKGYMGNNGDLMYKLAGDLQWFKRITMGKPILMGRKTFESLPGLLPGRPHIVISRSPVALSNLLPVEQFSCPFRATLNTVSKYGKVMVIGGADILHTLLPYCNRIYLTKVFDDAVGDTQFRYMEALNDRRFVNECALPMYEEENGQKYKITRLERVW